MIREVTDSQYGKYRPPYDTGQSQTVVILSVRAFLIECLTVSIVKFK